MHGYIKAENKDQLMKRLDRIEGQVRGIKRMVDREAYCIDIVTQITSLIAASEKVASMLIKDHVDYCVREATGRILSRQTAFEPQLVRMALQACAQACQLCGDECEQHAQHGMEHCRACAEACRRCESACNNLLSAIGA